MATGDGIGDDHPLGHLRLLGVLGEGEQLVDLRAPWAVRALKRWQLLNGGALMSRHHPARFVHPLDRLAGGWRFFEKMGYCRLNVVDPGTRLDLGSISATWFNYAPAGFLSATSARRGCPVG